MMEKIRYTYNRSNARAKKMFYSTIGFGYSKPKVKEEQQDPSKEERTIAEKILCFVFGNYAGW